MSDCYTPTDGEVLEAWAAHNTPDLPTALDLVAAYDAFKRWLAEHDAKVRAEEREKADREPSDAEVEAARTVAEETHRFRYERTPLDADPSRSYRTCDCGLPFLTAEAHRAHVYREMLLAAQEVRRAAADM